MRKMMNKVELPVCYVVQVIKTGTYIKKANVSTAMMPHVIKEHINNTLNSVKYFYTDNIALANMWTTTSKIKRFLTADSAEYLQIICSTGEMFPATDLLK